MRPTVTVLACLAAMAAFPAWAADLTVRIEGARSAEGTLMIGVYDSIFGFDRALKLYDQPDGFIRDRDRVAGAALRPVRGGGSLTFAGLTPGRYAVIVFHDANADGRMDKNLIGVPVEGYGFSNEARGFLSPPDFTDAAIEVAAPGVTARVRLSY